MSSRILLSVCILLILSGCGIFKKKSSSSPPRSDPPKTTSLSEKYSKIIGQRVTNEALYREIDQWIGTPYTYGGKTKSGIDCSNFVCQILKQVYQKPAGFYLPSAKLAEQGQKINSSQAEEGDLVFFSINSNSKVSHVGVYLANNKFVHASTSRGVMISSLQEEYYKKRFLYLRRVH